MTTSGGSKWLHSGLLILRIGIGVMFMLHGYGKVFDGPERWERLGESMGHLGITFAPVFWGFMAAISEFFGGALMILGLLFRPAMALMFMTMVVATADHLGEGDSVLKASHAIEDGIVFLSLLIIGPGKYTVIQLLRRRAEIAKA